MKNQFRKLNLISKFLDLGLFYSITVSLYEIQLQGWITTKNIESLNKWFEFSTYNEDYLRAVRWNIVVVLTPENPTI